MWGTCLWTNLREEGTKFEKVLGLLPTLAGHGNADTRHVLNAGCAPGPVYLRHFDSSMVCVCPKHCRVSTDGLDHEEWALCPLVDDSSVQEGRRG